MNGGVTLTTESEMDSARRTRFLSTILTFKLSNRRYVTSETESVRDSNVRQILGRPDRVAGCRLLAGDGWQVAGGRWQVARVWIPEGDG